MNNLICISFRFCCCFLAFSILWKSHGISLPKWLQLKCSKMSTVNSSFVDISKQENKRKKKIDKQRKMRINRDIYTYKTYSNDTNFFLHAKFSFKLFIRKRMLWQVTLKTTLNKWLWYGVHVALTFESSKKITKLALNNEQNM